MSAIRLRGATSGTTDVVAAAIAGDGVLTLPSGTGTLATAAYVDAAVAAGGKVLQVVSVTKTDFFSTTASSWTDVTGLTATITPSATSSKILVMVNVFMGLSNFNGLNFFWKMVRGSTNIGIGTAGSNNLSGGGNLYRLSDDVAFFGGTSKNHLDAPATTSATTYKVQISKNNATGTIFVNRRASATSDCGISTITLMEIGA
jgi:hypothetical protein